MPTAKHANIKTTKIESFDHYLETINSYDSDTSIADSILLFRGQLNAGWDLLPGIARKKTLLPQIVELEKEVLDEFKRRAIPFLPNSFNSDSDWEWMALAQHFKLPTRLLDWTENALIALFFAFEFEKEDTANRAVWIFATNKDELVDTSDETSKPFSQTKTKVYVPNQVTQRISAQSGWFTVHKYIEKSTKFIPFNKNSAYTKRIYKLSIPNDLRAQILLRLNRLGVNSFSIYPDLEGLSNFLNWKYFK